MKLDAKRREYDIVVIGEEPHLAYNRVGLSAFFQHRRPEDLYLNPKQWVRCIEDDRAVTHANQCTSILIHLMAHSITISIL